MTVRALGSARADISDVVLERLTPLDSAVAAVQARSETGDGADCKDEHQCFASHVRVLLASAERPVAATERPGLDDVGEDLALPLIQSFVNLGERLERVAPNTVDHGVVAIEDGGDRFAVERLRANHRRYVGPSAAKLALGVVDLVQQRVDGLADDLLLTWRGVESVEQAIQDEAPATGTKPARPAATMVVAVTVVMVAPRERRGEAQQTSGSKQKSKHFSAPSRINLGALCEGIRRAGVKKR